MVSLNKSLYKKKVFKPEKYFFPGDVIENIRKSDIKGAKVTIINMPIREQAKPGNPPMGPALLAARLRLYDVQVNIVDLNAYRIEDEVAKLRNLPNGRMLTFEETERLLEKVFNKFGDQDLIAFSGLITTLRWQKEVAKSVRKYQPEALLVSGGGLATEFRGILFNWIPELDAIAHSEGDDIIVKIAFDAKTIREMGFKDAILSGKLAPYCFGVEKGRPRFYYDGGRPNDLNTLPFPAWDLLESDINDVPVLDNYIRTPVWGDSSNNSSATPFSMDRSLSLISSRGCPFNCRFCFRGAQGERNYGIRSAQNVIDEMTLNTNRYDLDFIGIIDDNFMVSPKRIEELSEKIQPLLSEKKIRWGTHGRLDEAAKLKSSQSKKRTGLTPNSTCLAEKMAEAGCVYIGFGAESASSYVLDKMGKGGFILKNGEVKINGFKFPVSMVEGIKRTMNAGIHANCTWIMGYPGESLEDLKTSIAFIKWQEELYTQDLFKGTVEYDAAINSVNKQMFVATAYPGTEMFINPVVRERLSKTFGINFNKVTGEAIPDEYLYNYVKELDDATKVLVGKAGVLYYGDMDIDQFMQAKEYVESRNLFKILEM